MTNLRTMEAVEVSWFKVPFLLDGAPSGFLLSQAPRVCACSVALALVLSDCLRPPGQLSPMSLSPGDSPGKNTGVGCRFLLHKSQVGELDQTTDLVGVPLPIPLHIRQGPLPVSSKSPLPKCVGPGS